MTNEELGFSSSGGSNPYADTPVAKKEETKISTSSSVTPKITKAALTGVADIAVAAPAVATPASAAALPVQAPAVAPPLPHIDNPVNDPEYWKSALISQLPTLGVGLLSGIAGAYGLNKLGKPAPAGGNPPPPPPSPGASTAAPADVIPKPAPFAQGSAPQPNVAYQEPSYNQPKGTPNPLNAATPPAEVAPAPVKPLTAIESAKLQEVQNRIAAQEALAKRDQELHEAKLKRDSDLHDSRMAKDAAKSEVKNQQTQGKSLDDPESIMQKQSTKNAVDKAVDADMKAAAIKSEPPAAPVSNITPATIVTPVPEAAPTTPTTITPTEDVSAVAGGNKPSAAKRRTAEQIMSDKTEQQFTGAKKQLLTNLGNQYGEDYSKAAHEALGIAKERLGKGEKFSMEPGTGKVTEHWAKMKADMLANPEAYPDITVKHIQKSVEQVKKEVAQKKAAESQRGGANVNAIGEAGSKVAGAVKPILGQTGALVGSELKGAAAMLPFMLATDVQAQNAGYRRELEQQMKTERNASRSAELKSELQKLDEEKYLKAMKRRYVDRNVPAQFRPQ